MLPIVEIIRLEEDFQYGTFGKMRINKQVFCETLEPADNENAQNISSIPAQQYICKRIDSPKYSDTFEITNVPERSHVLFHPGNTRSHTRGCVMLGQYVGKLKELRAVINSGDTFKQFMAIMTGYDEFHLTIHEYY